MELKDVPKPKLYTSMRNEVREIRENAPNYLAALVEPLHDRGVFHDIRSLDDILPTGVEVLEGGANSACYWIAEPDSAVVLKIQKEGVSSEAEWLETFRNDGVRVPGVLAYGVIPGEEHHNRPTRFIALEGLLDDKGKRVKSVGSYVKDNPEMMRVVSGQMGAALAKIHSVVSDKPFGSYEDQEDGVRTFGSWKEFLTESIRSDQLQTFGVSSAKHSEIISALDSIEFPEQGVYVHGDFNSRNVMMLSSDEDPVQIAVIDPAPHIGDPYWDLGNIGYINDLISAKTALDTTVAGNPKLWWEDNRIDVPLFLEAYFGGSPTELDPKRLAANQIALMLRSFERKRTPLADADITETQKKQFEIELKLRKQVLNEKIEILTAA